jgi:hypothetical protein
MPPESKLPASNPDEFLVHSEGREKPLKIKLKGAGKNKYDVWKKDIPPDAPTTWTDPDDGQVKTISWHNNFGLKQKGQEAFDETVDEYDIELDEVPGSDIVYYANKKVIKFKNVKGVGSGTLTVSLNLGDPSIGSTP